MKILLLEDNAMIARGLVRILSIHGLQAEWAGCASRGMQMLQRSPDYQAVVADYGLHSKTDGLDFLRQVRVRYPHLRRILVSGSSVNLPGDTVHTYLQKPFDDRVLVAALREPTKLK